MDLSSVLSSILSIVFIIRLFLFVKMSARGILSSQHDKLIFSRFKHCHTLSAFSAPTASRHSPACGRRLMREINGPDCIGSFPIGNRTYINAPTMPVMNFSLLRCSFRAHLYSNYSSQGVALGYVEQPFQGNML